jgi:hypothetical protein
MARRHCDNGGNNSGDNGTTMGATMTAMAQRRQRPDGSAMMAAMVAMA